jgi:hypothetical protein
MDRKSGQKRGRSKKKVLFICLFNVERSVTAEAIFRKMLAEASVSYADEIEVTSRGFVGRLCCMVRLKGYSAARAPVQPPTSGVYATQTPPKRLGCVRVQV